MDENWIIPAITLAYAVQFIIDMVLLRFAVHHSKRVTAAIEEAQLSQVDEISSS
ncbi:hypothetical protein BDV93DRAFT_529963 [Ceratobasidium sp. AG-I]|nr:hypothetical protein BDV93DRAFT_529963 [Ceratobasidium sp. AG-I]